MQITVYGIKNCDTMKKAFTWLDEQGMAYQFHDYKKAGVPAALVAQWAARWGWEALLKKTGTTWRKIPETERLDLDEARALALLSVYPSLIRRPIVMVDGEAALVGFAADGWMQALRQRSQESGNLP
ncbi:arsenate reductase [Acidithiobacillus sp.]